MEIWPTSIVVPRGYRIGLSVRGRDYVYPGFEQPPMPTSGRIYFGVDLFRHDHKKDRPRKVIGGELKLHTGPQSPGPHPLARHPDEVNGQAKTLFDSGFFQREKVSGFMILSTVRYFFDMVVT